jgi:hypothetical protein
MRTSTAMNASSAVTRQWDLYNSFILDSGATTHICHTRDRFKNFRPTEEALSTAGAPIQIHGYGDVDITIQGAKGPRTITLKNTAYIPDCTTNMISCHKVLKSGIIWDQLNNQLTQFGQTYCKITVINDLYVIEHNPITFQQAAFIAKRFTKSTAPKPDQEVTVQTLHRRFAHASLTAIKHLPKSSHGITITNPEDQFSCEVCFLAKGKRLIHREPTQPPRAPYEVVAFDLIEFKPVDQDAGSAKYALHFYCRFTGMNHVYILPDKSEKTLLRTIQEFCAYVTRRWSLKVCVFQTDGETGLSNTSVQWIKLKGISLNRSPTSTQDQNGGAERSGGVIIIRARSMHIDSELPPFMWPEVLLAAGYLLNRTPRQSHNWKTPLEVLQTFMNFKDLKPKCGHIRVYGCRAYPLIQDNPKLNKLGPRSVIGYLCGWDSTNVFRIWIPSLHKVIRTRDVVFDESVKYNPRQIEPPMLEPLVQTIQLMEIADDEVLGEEEPPSRTYTTSQNLTPYNQELIPYKSPYPPIQSTGDAGLITPDVTPEVTPEPISPDLSDAHNTTFPGNSTETQETQEETTIVVSTNFEQDATVQRSRDRSQGVDTSNIISEPRTRKPTARKAAYLSALDTVTELTGYHTAFMAGAQIKVQPHRTELPEPPKRWRDLETHPHAQGFKQAALKEYTELESRGTWQIVDESSTHIKPLPLKWVFTYKFDTDGYLERYKARICVRGDLQPLNDRDNYAATLAAKVFRTVMAIVAYFDLDAEQWDAINAFINGIQDEEIHTYFPDGFKISGKILRLLRALYGLRRSPLIWLNEFSRTLTELGLTQIPESQCLFTNGHILVFFYVDDIVIISHPKHRAECQEFKEKLLQKYQFKQLGELKWFLGIRILRDRSKKLLWLCQDAYIEKITRNFNLINATHFNTPLSTDDFIPNTSKATPQEIHAYQSRIGSTTYATTITRPDSARASNKLAEFMLNPSPTHIAAANRLIKYLYDTRYLAIQYGYDRPNDSGLDPEFRCSTDAAFADDIPTRKSTEGYLFKLFGGPIDWRSTKQKQVTTSSTEAELMALSHASTELYWWRRFFQSIQLELDPYKVECDNQQTIRLITTPAIKLATKLKHVDIHNHWLRQEVQEKRLYLDWIPTNDMPADGLTKALPKLKHRTFIQQLGLVNIQHLIEDSTHSI